MFSQQVHRTVFLIGLCGLAFGMMVGTVPTSIPQILLMANWLFEPGLVGKVRGLLRNRIFWILSSVFLVHLLGLLWTSDLGAGGFDVRTKIPLMFLPLLLLSSRPLEVKEYRMILGCFLAGCTVNISWCFIYGYVLHKGEGIRGISRFMSHIRLGLYLNMALVVCAYFFSVSAIRWQRTAIVILVLYFLAGLLFMGLVSGIVLLIILMTAFLLLRVRKQSLTVILVTILGFVALVTASVFYLLSIKNAQLNKKEAEVNRPAKLSPGGNPYFHFDTTGQKENGYYVLMNIQLWELDRVWRRDFRADSFNYATKHNLNRYEVLVRYMTSKGLFKDSVGYAQLSVRDKENIKQGVTNYLFPGWSLLHRRAYELVNEYDEFMHGGRVSGHSLSMRLYFWKAALISVRNHPLRGVGTGDVQQELNRIYKGSGMPLSEEWYKRPHNQYLTIAVALGIPGLLIFLFSLFYPAFSLRKKLPEIYWPFFALALLSFVFEDTLETQAGLTFFAFFNTLLLAVGSRSNEGQVNAS